MHCYYSVVPGGGSGGSGLGKGVGVGLGVGVGVGVGAGRVPVLLLGAPRGAPPAFVAPPVFPPVGGGVGGISVTGVEELPAFVVSDSLSPFQNGFCTELGMLAGLICRTLSSSVVKSLPLS